MIDTSKEAVERAANLVRLTFHERSMERGWADLMIALAADRDHLRREVEEARDNALDEAADQAWHACLVPPDGGSPTDDEVAVCEEAAKRILALKEPTND